MFDTEEFVRTSGGPQMRRRNICRGLVAAAIGGALAVATTTTSQAAPPPLTNPAKAAALASKLGDKRTAGVYYRSGRLVVAVTDQSASETVRNAGGVAEMVPNSTADLDSIKAELDRLAGIPNTAWDIDPTTNRVDVQLYDGVSAADRARIEKVISGHRDAAEITEHSGKIESTASYLMRGGLGITSGFVDTNGTQWTVTCSAGFNVQDSTGKRYMLTAGHCMNDGATAWSRRSGNIPLGIANDWVYGNDSDQSDYGIVPYSNPDILAYGAVQYRDGSEGAITDAAPPYVGEETKRIGTMSQDLIGKVLSTEATVTYSDGITLHHMIKASNCVVHGDSGGPLFTGETALGIASGGNYADTACGDQDAQSDRVSFYEPVWRISLATGLNVY